MKSSRGLFIAIAAVSFIGSSIGCYTMLKHPRVQTDDSAVSAHDDDMMIGFADDCASCHSASSLRTHHPAIPPPRHVVSPTWDYYYDNPWWMPYYTPAVPGSGAPTADEEQKKRPFDRRHLSQPEDTNTPAASAPAPTPSAGTVAKPADSGASQPAAPQPQDTNKREEKRSGDSQSGERRTRKP